MLLIAALNCSVLCISVLRYVVLCCTLPAGSSDDAAEASSVDRDDLSSQRPELGPEVVLGLDCDDRFVRRITAERCQLCRSREMSAVQKQRDRSSYRDRSRSRGRDNAGKKDKESHVKV